MTARPEKTRRDDAPAGHAARCPTPHPGAADRVERLARLYARVEAAGGESAARAAGLPASVTDLPRCERGEA